MKDLKVRVLSAIVGLALLVFIISRGDILLATSILLVSLMGLREFYRALNNIGLKTVDLIGYLGALGIYLSNAFGIISIGLVFYLLTALLLIKLLFNKNLQVVDIAATLLGITYIPFFMFYIYKLDGSPYIWLVFIIAFGTDTFAYLVGNLFGKNKLCPEISPNKSREGAIGGVLGSLILTLIFGYINDIDSLGGLIILSVITSIISQMGDLIASRIKRLAKIKDYGFIMPGHGGVLDRFDSIIFSAPLIYYYVTQILI